MLEVDHELVQIVEAQGRGGVGIPVLLFTDETLDSTDATDATDPGRDPNVVQRAAAELGYDLPHLELFSTESYLLQVLAGRMMVGPAE